MVRGRGGVGGSSRGGGKAVFRGVRSDGGGECGNEMTFGGKGGAGGG